MWSRGSRKQGRRNVVGIKENEGRGGRGGDEQLISEKKGKKNIID
jgi:hypothetical protein